MFLSIVIPTYNCEKYIEDCMASIKDEIDENAEVIIIDDGSTDNTQNIIKKYTDKNFRYFRNENHGVSFSRNFGIKKAKGEYIMFVDADDVLMKNWYHTVQQEKYSGYDIVYFSCNYHECDVSQLEIIENIVGYPSHKNLGNLSSPWSKLYKRTFLLNNDISFEEKIINGEDLLFNLKSILLTSNVKIIGKSIYQYRINLNSATHKFDEDFFRSNSDFLRIMYQYFNELSDYPIDKFYEFCMFNSVYIFIYRIALIKNVEDSKNKYYIFKAQEYRNFLKEYHFKRNYGLIKNLFIYLVKYNYIGTAIYLMKIKIVFQNLKINKGLWEEI